MVDFGTFIPDSTIDWHRFATSTFFLRGCPMLCPYCFNSKLNSYKNEVPDEQIVALLDKCHWGTITISGGEPFTQADFLRKLTTEAHNRGMKVAVHTCGYYPDRLESAVRYYEIDAVMLDFKCIPSKYACLTGVQADRVIESVKFLNANKHMLEYYEVRTTVFKGISSTKDEIEEIKSIVSPDKYVLQLGVSQNGVNPISIEALRTLAKETNSEYRL